MKLKHFSLILVLLMLSMVGCSNQETADLSYDGNLKLVLPDQTVEIAYNDIYAMTSVTETLKSVTSSGEEITTEVVGISLSQLLESYNIGLKDLQGVRGIAGDGYAIDVPGEILTDKDIYLIWSEDGEFYDEKKMPLRMAIHDERAMYWVSNLMEVHCLINQATAEETSVASQIVFLEAASKSLDMIDITYYEAVDKGVSVPDLFTLINPSNSIKFIATDNFEKTETLETLNQGFIKMTGEKAPLFMSPDLPKGMHVKYILQMQTGDTAFVSESNALDVYTSMTVDSDQGISLIELIDQAGLKADTYTFTSTDGYSVEVAGRDVKKGILVKDGDMYKVKFDGLPKNTTIKDIYSISASSSQAASTQESSGSGNLVLNPWTITFTGLSDGSFDFTNEKAERKLELVTLEATKTSKDGASYDQVWQGYRIKDVLDFLHVETFEEIKVIASDGYEMTFTSDQVDDNMILGVIVDGEAISVDKGSVQLVSSSMTSNFWVKYIATIEVK